MIEPNRR